MLERLLGTDPAAVSGGEALVLLTRAATRVAVPVAMAITLVALLLRGSQAGLTAGGVALLVVGLHVGSGLVTARLSRANPLLMPAVTMVALLVRLGIYGAVVLLLGDAPGIDVVVLAVTVVALTFAILAVETLLVARYSRFWWAAPADDAATDDAPSPDLTTAPVGAGTPTSPRATERTDA